MKDWLKSLLLPDQRKASRKKMPPLVAYFWDGGRPVAHNVRDISSSGFYLTTEERWLLGTLVMITLQRTKAEADRPDCSLIVMAKVVHHGGDGVGFTFLPVDSATPGQRPRPGSHAADRKTLEKFLQRLAADRD
ncbi:MAG TPA: PilZ domain-containing protein [Acidobacteriaceae bacterium]|jgi:hypothetical protein|nr:PilZ domain-containing protein [Acidobacteriaceae bacterium]